MPEILLHYIWYMGLFSSCQQSTSDNQKLEIINVGEHNTDAGPDFVNARIRFFSTDEKQYIDIVGNIEIHISSSDWFKHKHDKDQAYDNVILHVVKKIDRKVFNSKGVEIPQCQLQYIENEDYLTSLLADAQQMDSSPLTSLCRKYLCKTPELLTIQWRTALCTDRLKCKKQSINRLLEITNGDGNEAFYITLAHNFGFHTNSIPFEQMAIQTPLNILNRHRDNIFQLTAILLGQSGLLTDNANLIIKLLGENTYALLYNEYRKWQNVYQLESIPPHMWKHARIHPNNFPEIRIIQFAKLLNNSQSLFDKISTYSDCERVCKLFDDVANPNPTGFSQFLNTIPNLGVEGIKTLLINTAIPFKFARGEEKTAISWLKSLPAEKNGIINKWKMLGQKVISALDSQALLHLFLKYCHPKNCFQCDVAFQIFMQNKNILQDDGK